MAVPAAGGALRLLGKHAASGAFFYPNFAMRGEPGGYFATGLDFRPLLPLWSLGVEEQFYLFWPPVLLLALRRGLSLPLILAVLCALSFAAKLWLSHGHPMAAYYLPFGRAWEILAGAALTLVKTQPGRLVAAVAGQYGAVFRSPTRVLCNAGGCLTRAGDPPYLTTFDQGHMTPQGARLLADAFAEDLRP